MYGNGSSAYRQAGVMTADPKKLILMCYEEAIRNLKIAKAKYVTHEYEEKAKALIKTQAFICASTLLSISKRRGICSNLQSRYN